MYNDDFITNTWHNYYFLLGGGGYIRYFLDDIEAGVSLTLNI